jgi:hypothetical protein
LDSTAEGYGWFTATSSSAEPPANEIDLLTVVSHELGHLFGLMDGDGTPLMAPTLAAGRRILPSAADLAVPHGTLVGRGGPTAANAVSTGHALPAHVLDAGGVGTVDWLTAVAGLKPKTDVYADWLEAAGRE